MSRSLWRCRNRDCPVPHGVVLGRLTANSGLVLDGAVTTLAVYFDTRTASITCPQCGTIRRFSGTCIFLNGPPLGFGTVTSVRVR